MRLPLNRILRKITRYRLGYNVQRDYPGRWTTLVVIVVYMALAVFLALMNIPLTAYDVVQEYTYTPNATVPPLPFSYLIPSFLKPTLPDFSPQTLHVGDVLHLNNSTEEYTITSADAVDGFLFYNNPLTSCDVQNVTIRIDIYQSSIFDSYRPLMSADISCWVPVPFSLHWEAKMLDGFSDDVATVMVACRFANAEIVDLCGDTVPSGNITESIMTAQAYCPSPVPGGNLKLRSMQDHLPCNSDPIGFVTFDEALNISDTQFLPFLLNHPRTSDCIQFRDEECASIYQFTKENALQDVYHSIRRDLGIHSPNQIWASPDMFNKTIRAIPGSGTSASAWGANELRANRSAGTWTPWDMEHDESVKTPKIFYSRWTYRQKSLGSAITNVFVATFTMLAAIWKIFCFIAGLVISKVDDLATPPSELENEVRELRELMLPRTEVRASVQEEIQRMMRYPASKYRLSLADMGDSTLTESLLSSVDHDSKEEAWNGSRDGYDRV